MSQLALLYRLSIPGGIFRVAEGFYPHPQTGAPPWMAQLERIRNSGRTLGHQTPQSSVLHTSKGKA